MTFIVRCVFTWIGPLRYWIIVKVIQLQWIIIMGVSFCQSLNFIWHPHIPCAFILISFMNFYVFEKLCDFLILIFFLQFFLDFGGDLWNFTWFLNNYRIWNIEFFKILGIFTIYFKYTIRFFKKVWVFIRFFIMSEVLLDFLKSTSF